MRIFGASLLLLGALLLPATAGAQTVPPGNSGADQYTESLPGAGGNESTGSGQNGQGSQEALSPSARQGLEQLGADGQATADLAQATSPRSDNRGQKAPAGGGAASSDPGGSSGFADVLGQAGGEGGSAGMGLLLPLILAASVLAGVAFVLVHRRGDSAAEHTS